VIELYFKIGVIRKEFNNKNFTTDGYIKWNEKKVSNI
jgi:hypothetical protein